MLQRGGFPLGRQELVGDLAHLGVHGGTHHQARGPAISDGGTPEGQVHPVAQRSVFRRDHTGVLLHRHRLAGQGGLLNLQGTAFQ
ncbi:hypothetical protein SDC9_83452 [bioreactor metagenome]|uniref:Uncharacterized protein n=1 Tax=bioreactor metagenome TaxID=1076179 RepID=A0A644Z991_9ZZZZ